MSRTITRADIVSELCRQRNVSRAEATQFLDQTLEEIVRALERGEDVRIASFGSFSVRRKNERVGRNPKTGEVVPISPRWVVSFKASEVLKDLVNKVLRKRVET